MADLPIDGHLITPTTGLEVHYRDWGGPAVPDGGQAPVLLLHGLASTCHIYDLCAPLLARTRRVVAYDQRGHGDTAKPEDGYDTETFAADGIGVAQALHLSEPYVVVGHSWGALVALAWAAWHPERVRALVLVDGAIFPFREAPGATWEHVAERLAPPDLSGLPLESLLERSRAGLSFLDEPFRRAYFGALMQILPDGTVRARLPRDKHMRILRTMWDADASGLFAALRCPTLALLARRTPADEEGRRMEELRVRLAGRLAQAQPLLRVRWLGDTIHDVPLQRPALLAEAIADLADGSRN
jgi:pimeloyl-ACP methyl ester carboxylesterase